MKTIHLKKMIFAVLVALAFTANASAAPTECTTWNLSPHGVWDCD